MTRPLSLRQQPPQGIVAVVIALELVPPHLPVDIYLVKKMAQSTCKVIMHEPSSCLKVAAKPKTWAVIGA